MGKEKFKAGGSDGVTVWKRWCGEDTNIQVFGWEMKFEVDANGNVSGGNKNDDNGNDIKKFYSGTFINDQMDVQVEWTDGRKCTYVSSFTHTSIHRCTVVTHNDTERRCCRKLSEG